MPINTKWLISTSKIKAGNSAILDDKIIFFYWIHSSALFVISVSMISCCVVLVHLTKTYSKRSAKSKSNSSRDFALRFPLYLAIADLLWGMAHFMDHAFLLIHQKYSENPAVNFFGVSLWMFFGYQQTMHVLLSGYMYLKVVRLITLDLGRYEWKLQCTAISIIISSTVAFYFLDGFGPNGYWYASSQVTTGGYVLTVVGTIAATANAFVTTCGYYMIKRKIEMQKQAFKDHLICRNKVFSTATECLSTFVKVGACLYCPSAVLGWVFTIFYFLGYLEPISVSLIVIAANSGGWANTWGYFYNNRLKSINKENKILTYTVASGADTHTSTSYT